MKIPPLLPLFLVAAARAQVTDPHITTWLTANAGQYAQIYQTAAAKAAGTTSVTWPSAGLTNGGGGQSTPAYSDVQRVAYSANYVYITTSGLASYIMGNWLTPTGQTYTSWPTDRAAIQQIPRNPVIPTTKQPSRGSGGVWVNGVFLWEDGDAQSYTTSTGMVSMQGQGVWNRLASAGEAFNFDTANGHQPSNGLYHNHINPIALRYQLGDNVVYNASTRTYSELAAPTRHSPILGWANDGLPVYGPYGYSSAMDPASGIRRMVSGFQLRDGSNGTTNLAATGRTTLPAWAASVQGTSQTLPATSYGPGTTQTYQQAPGLNSTYFLGTFAEDYDYKGDHGMTQGVDFDLNVQNVRYCVTPEYPNGTWAYFVSIGSSGSTYFPDVINQQYFGTVPNNIAMTEGVVSSINEAVTEYVDAGPAAALVVTAATAGAGATLTWNSSDGATYQVESSPDQSAWTTLSSAVTSGGLTTSYTASQAAAYYRVTLTAMATYDSGGTYGTPVGASAIATFGAAVIAPTIFTSQPSAETIASGSTVVFAAAASGAPSYQWYLNGAPIAGATGSELLVTDATTANAGSYTCSADISGNAVLSTAAVLTVNPDLTPAHLVNLSIISDIAGALTMGFLTTPATAANSEPVLIRACGPALASLGYASDYLPDPALTVYQQSPKTQLTANAGWGANAAAVEAADGLTGAFALTNTASKDSALVASLPVVTGGYSAVVTGASGDSGEALTEVYDATASANYTQGVSPRLSNLSCAAFIPAATAANPNPSLTVGFVLGPTSTGARTILVRVSGPTLATLGYPTTFMPDPQLSVVPLGSSTSIAANAGWAGNAAISSVVSSLGTFPFASTTSGDSAVLLTLTPTTGYTVNVSSVTHAGGEVLVEIYEVP